jgi:hypothetical protein
MPRREPRIYRVNQAVLAASEISLASREYERLAAWGEPRSVMIDPDRRPPHNCEPKYWVNARAAGEGAPPTG